MLAVSREADAFRVEVRDPGDGFDPAPDRTREGGFGLAIVSHIARRWGVIDGAGTVVWCEVAIPR